jgi:hypothetical protein
MCADTELKEFAEFIGFILWISLLYFNNQLRLLLSRAKKAAAFFNMSLSLLARHNCFSNA